MVILFPYLNSEPAQKTKNLGRKVFKTLEAKDAMSQVGFSKSSY